MSEEKVMMAANLVKTLLENEITSLRTQNAAQAERIRELERLVTSQGISSMEDLDENQQLRAALVSVREKITTVEVDVEEVFDFDECTAMFIPMDAYYGLVETGEQIDAILSGQPDGPGEEDGPWAEGWKERVGQSVEDPRDKSDCHGLDWTERDMEYLK